jgi:hypothetical protein
MSRTLLLFGFVCLTALLLSSCASTPGLSGVKPIDQATDTPAATVTATDTVTATATAPVKERATPTSPPVPTVNPAVPTPDLGGIDPEEIVTLLPRDAIPAIWDPEPLWATVEEAEQNGDISNAVSIIGVSIGSEARAYPIPFLSAHEIVNDTVGGTAIAVTW